MLNTFLIRGVSWWLSGGLRLYSGLSNYCRVAPLKEPVRLSSCSSLTCPHLPQGYPPSQTASPAPRPLSPGVWKPAYLPIPSSPRTGTATAATSTAPRWELSRAKWVMPGQLARAGRTVHGISHWRSEVVVVVIRSLGGSTHPKGGAHACTCRCPSSSRAPINSKRSRAATKDRCQMEGTVDSTTHEQAD